MKRNKNIQLYIMLLPAVILFMLLVVYPFLTGIRISFMNWNGYSQDWSFAGLSNYTSLLTDSVFKRALMNTIIYGIGCTFIQNVLGLAYAILVNQKFATRSLVKTFVYLPSIISGLVMGYMMYNMFQYSSGALNDVMTFLGKDRIDWLGDGNSAVLIIVIINSIQFVGVSMIIYLAGLQGIPKSLIEASTIDGAKKREVFRFITLPLLIPSIKSSIMINLIGGLQLFGVIMALTNGGPGNESHSVATLISYRYFSNEDAGGAAAIGLILFIIIFGISYITNNYFKTKEVEM